jgi:hypothetical protein
MTGTLGAHVRGTMPADNTAILVDAAGYATLTDARCAGALPTPVTVATGVTGRTTGNAKILSDSIGVPQGYLLAWRLAGVRVS